MDAKDAIQSSANMSSMVLKTYISDLDDGDLMQRPAKGCNHLAWQLGHLISSELMLLDTVGAEVNVDLPDGFAETHSKENATSDDTSAFCSKAEYLELFEKVNKAASEALRSYPEAKLGEPAPEHFRSFCPTMGDVFTLIATHPMMHAGQFAVVRRELNKPILM